MPIAPGLLGYLLLDPLMDSSKWWLWIVELIPAFALYRWASRLQIRSTFASVALCMCWPPAVRELDAACCACTLSLHGRWALRLGLTLSCLPHALPALRRGLYEMGAYAFLGVYRNSAGMRFHNLSDDKNGMVGQRRNGLDRWGYLREAAAPVLCRWTHV